MQSPATQAPPLSRFSIQPAFFGSGLAITTFDCTGGVPGTPIVLNFISFMNVSVLNTGGWILTDGVHNFAGTLVPSKCS